MRTIILPIVLAALAGPAVAEPREVFGYGGELGEWELSATVTEKVASHSRDLSGPLTMTHVGICTQDGPERKTGEIRFQVLDVPPQLMRTLHVDWSRVHLQRKVGRFYRERMICPAGPECQ
jgi:hypothetical protein